MTFLKQHLKYSSGWVEYILQCSHQHLVFLATLGYLPSLLSQFWCRASTRKVIHLCPLRCCLMHWFLFALNSSICSPLCHHSTFAFYLFTLNGLELVSIFFQSINVHKCGTRIWCSAITVASGALISTLYRLKLINVLMHERCRRGQVKEWFPECGFYVGYLLTVSSFAWGNRSMMHNYFNLPWAWHSHFDKWEINAGIRKKFKLVK